MVDSSVPSVFKSGVSPVDIAYYKDGAGAWTSLAITDTATEIGSTGLYELDLTASELNHDYVIIKFAVSGAADTAFLFNNICDVRCFTMYSFSIIPSLKMKAIIDVCPYGVAFSVSFLVAIFLVPPSVD